MFERRISQENVKYVIQKGEIVENYPNDLPYPSRLILGWIGSKPLHVVLAENMEQKEWIVITVYEPDSNKWDNNFRMRKP
jgi:uncharacterized protein DUF4258